MQNVWVISGGVTGRQASFEYYVTEGQALTRAEELETEARRTFDELDARVGLGVTWEQYCEIQDLVPYEVQEIPHVESQNPHDDRVLPTGERPTGQIWLILEDGLPEEERGYEATEQEAQDTVWNRNWARWEYYEESEESATMTFTECCAETSGVSRPIKYDYAPADPGPA